jgi:hypothetical protein
LKYLKEKHPSNGWKNSGLELNEESLGTKRIRRTVAKVSTFYHPDCSEVRDASLDWLFNEITKVLNNVLDDIDSTD